MAADTFSGLGKPVRITSPRDTESAQDWLETSFEYNPPCSPALLHLTLPALLHGRVSSGSKQGHAPTNVT